MSVVQKNIKIIELSNTRRNKTAEYPKSDTDLYYVSSWSGLFARRLKQKHPQLDIEVWRTEREICTAKTKSVFGVIGKIYPYKAVIVPETLTLSMIKTLLSYQDQFTLIIHYTQIYNLLFNYILPVLLKRTKFVLSHLGGKPPAGSIKKRMKNYLLRRSFKRIHAVTYIRKEIRDWLIPAYDKDKMCFLPAGADYKVFIEKDKLLCRRHFGLDDNKIYGIYLGKYFRLKSVDLILEAYNRFKDEYNFSVIFVGGKNNDTNDLFAEVQRSGCPYWEYIKQEDLVTLFSAADFYIHPVFNEKFGGFDTSLIEAMACNRPVLSPQLSELSFDTSELGITINSKNQFYESLKKMLNTYYKFKKVRKISEKYLDGNNAIVDRLLSVLKS